MIHRTKEKVIAHHRIEHQLEEHAVPNHFITEVQDTTVSVFREEQILVRNTHSDHGDEECDVTDDIVNL